MSKRQTLAEQVGAQAIELRDLNAELATIKADFRTLESLHEAVMTDHATLKSENESLAETIAMVRGVNEKLTKELDSQKSTYTYTSRAKEAAETQLEQAHAALDAIPEAVSRKYEKAYGEADRDLSSRIIGTILAVVRSGK